MLSSAKEGAVGVKQSAASGRHESTTAPTVRPSADPTEEGAPAVAGNSQVLRCGLTTNLEQQLQHQTSATMTHVVRNSTQEAVNAHRVLETSTIKR